MHSPILEETPQTSTKKTPFWLTQSAKSMVPFERDEVLFFLTLIFYLYGPGKLLIRLILLK